MADNYLSVQLTDSYDGNNSLAAEMTMSCYCSLKSSVPSALTVTKNMVDGKYALFSVDPYVIVSGYPVSRTEMGVHAQATSGFNAGAYTRVGAPSRTDLIGAKTRWIAGDSYCTSTSWYPVAGDKAYVWKSPDVDTFPDKVTSGFLYLNGRDYITFPDGYGALRCDEDSYMNLPDISYANERHTIIAVVIARVYGSSPMTLIETSSTNNTINTTNNRNYVSVAYLPSGTVGLYADRSLSPLSTINVTDRGYSLARPIIVRLTVDTSASTVVYSVVGGRTTSKTHSIAHEYSGGTNIGGSPNDSTDSGIIDIIDVAYTTSDENTVKSIIAKYDNLYGVTV